MRKHFSNTVFFLAIFAVLLPADPPPAEAQQSQPTTWQNNGTTVCGSFIANFVNGGVACSNGKANITISSGGVTSISQGTGITNTPNPITATGTIAVNQAFSPTWTGNHAWAPGSTALIDFGVTNPGYVGLAADASILAAAGAGEVNLRFMTGAMRLPAGNLQWTGAAGSEGTLTAGAGGAFDITGGATSSFSTTAGDLVLGAFADLRISSNILISTTKTLAAGGNTLISGDKLQAPQLDGVVPLASLTGSGALAGTWSATAFGTVVANQNFTGPYRAVTNTGVFRNINCSAGTAGTTGSTDMQVQIYNVTDGAQLCGCTLGACNTGANTPLVCDCNGTFAAAKTYAVRFNNLGDCATPAQNIVCVVQMQQ